jgi:hypothetical protein
MKTKIKIDCEMIYNDSNNVITCMSKQYPNLTFEYKFNPNWDLDYNFSVVKELFINHWQDYIMKEKIKDAVKNKLAADFGRVAFSEAQIDAAIDLALNRCGYKGTVKKIAKEAINFLFA